MQVAVAHGRDGHDREVGEPGAATVVTSGRSIAGSATASMIAMASSWPGSQSMIRRMAGSRAGLPRGHRGVRRLEEALLQSCRIEICVGNADLDVVVFGTAHPAKFPEVVQTATGSEPTHPSLEALKSKPLQTYPMAATADAVKAFLRSKV